MVPRRPGSARAGSAAPRARGDGPYPGEKGRRLVDCSPRTRGWSRIGGRRRFRGNLLPAHAGMVPVVMLAHPARRPAPRARGDGPASTDRSPSVYSCSPRTRGWSHVLLRASAHEQLLPAHAGMVPSAGRDRTPASPAPRARGDGPGGLLTGLELSPCSPRTRGWSRIYLDTSTGELLLPAHAGMVPLVTVSRCPPLPAPRARGDGPGRLIGPGALVRCSPRTRGWSPDRLPVPHPRALLPAHAGMVPSPHQP